MKVSKHNQYIFEDSIKRIQEILDAPSEFKQVDVPNSDTLSYTDGYYFQCYSIFIDIRDSSKLPTKYPRKTLAKIYKAYISEVVALFQSSENCYEINIVGDSVWAIYQAQKIDDVLKVFHAAYAANSIVNTLNYQLCLKNIDPIKVGIGIDKGVALMVLAGYKGSGINDVIYMGGVVNNASKLCSKAGKNGNQTIAISQSVFDDLKDKHNGEKYYQSFFTKNFTENLYHADIIRTDMNDWLKDKQKTKPCTRNPK